MANDSIPLKAQSILAKFEGARESLSAFSTKHSRVVAEYEELKAQYNSALETVKSIYREKHETIGPRFGEFRVQRKTMVNAEKLRELLGEDDVAPFVKFKLTIVRDAYDAAVAADQIPDEIREEVEYEEVAIYGPAKK